MDSYSAQEETNYQAMKIHGRNLNAYRSVKEASLKMLHTVCIRLFDILEKAKLQIFKRLVFGSGSEGQRDA